MKPAWEPVVLARKPLDGTVAGNVAEYGTGALNIDGCRIDTDESTERPQGKDIRGGQWSGNGGRSDLTTGGGDGRWPANVALDGEAAAMLDAQTGYQRDAVAVTRNLADGGTTQSIDVKARTQRGNDFTYGGGGGASRFFYCAKASSSERPDGEVTHPTVKPLDLTRWLVRLVTPPDGLVLDPFAGTGTTAEAAVIEGFRSVLIEQHEPYLELIEARLSKPIQPTLGGAA